MTARPKTAQRDWRGRAKELLVSLRGRPDSEHEMSFNRLAFTTIALIFVAVADLDKTAVPGLLAFCVLSAVMFVHVMLDDGVRVWRRIFMMLADTVAISYFIHSNGAHSAGFWPLLLWTIFGNGFRFGTSYLYAATAACVIAFGVIIATTPFWQENMALAIGLLLGLIILPTFATKLIAKLSKAKQEAEEASRAKSYFLASVSHELRTPLTAIIGLSQHLESSNLPAEEKGMAGTIVTAGRSLLSLINQLLDFSRLGAKGITVELGELDLFELLSSIREILKVSAQKKGLRITIHISARTPLKIIGDKAHLRDVLVNLVGNAIKFTDQGSITISADVEEQRDGGLKLLLAVTDTGIGIKPEAQKHIFESFRQADNTIIDRFGGTGLGLAICKQVAELIGGEIGVESTPGVGSRFWFTSTMQPIENRISQAPERKSRFILFSADEERIAAFADMIAGTSIALEAADRLEEVYRLAAAVPADEVAAIVVDHRVLDAHPDTVDRLRSELAHGFKPVLLVADEDESFTSNAAIERAFVTVLSPRSSPEELRRAIRLGAAIDPDAAQSASAQPTAARRPLRILVADDNVMNQKVFSMILGRAGHQVELAGDGEAALDVMKDHQLDIVLMDVNMPVLNGIEATKLYRFTALGRRRIPIVGITADASIETMERCLDAGMDACISKPVEAVPLLTLIDDIVEKMAPGAIPAFDPTGVVTPLFPQATEEAPPISWEKLDDLEDLGGQEFVTDLLNEYVSDSQNLLRELRQSVADGDVTAFRSGTHALRSSGANIGATKVAELCLHLQRIERGEFDAKGGQHLEALEAELRRVRAALTERERKEPAAASR